MDVITKNYISAKEMIALQSSNDLLDAKVKYKERGTGKMSKKELVVYTNNGQSYVFHGVINFHPTTTGFSFSYLGKATGVVRSATFNNTSTAGYALAEDTEG